MKLKIRLCSKLFFISWLFIGGLIFTSTLFPAFDLLCKLPSAKQKRDWFKKLWFRCFRAIVGLKITQDGIPSSQSGLLVSNHISWLDIVALNQFFPGYFVAKSDILSWPVVGFLAKQGGTIFIRRGDKQHVKETTELMIWQLKQKSMVVVFPEGTTTRGDDVLSFHASLFQPALLTRSNVQVVALQYLGEAKDYAPFIGDAGFVPHLIKMLSLKKIEVRVTFLATINTPGKSRHAISNEARTLISDTLTGESQSKISQVHPILKQANRI